jgi:hypothetical protein
MGQPEDHGPVGPIRRPLSSLVCGGRAATVSRPRNNSRIPLWTRASEPGSLSVVTAWLVHMTHPMLTLVAALDAAVDEVAGVDPIYLTVPDKKAT